MTRAIANLPIRAILVRRAAGLVALLAGGLVASPALAQSIAGMPGSTVGLPADPFASNFPSEPPPRGVAPERSRAATAPRRTRAGRPARGARPVPPAEIPRR